MNYRAQYSITKEEIEETQRALRRGTIQPSEAAELVLDYVGGICAPVYFPSGQLRIESPKGTFKMMVGPAEDIVFQRNLESLANNLLRQ